MAVIGEIAVNVVAHTQQLLRNLGSARTALNAFGKGAQSVLSPLGRMNSLFATLGITLSAGALVHGLKRRVNEIDDLHDATTRLNATYTGLVTLQHAARIVGDDFEAVSMALKKMQLHLGQAADTGKGKGVTAFRELGLSAKQLLGMKTDDAFSRIADEMSRITNEGTKARLAFEIFGRGGQSVLNVINLGSKGIAEMRTEIEKLGLAMSDAEAGAIAELNDSLERLKQSYRGLQNEILKTVAPYASDVLAGSALALSTSRASSSGRSERIDTTTGYWGAQNLDPNGPVRMWLNFLGKWGDLSATGTRDAAIEEAQRRRGVLSPFGPAAGQLVDERSANQMAGQYLMNQGREFFRNAIAPNIQFAREKIFGRDAEKEKDRRPGLMDFIGNLQSMDRSAARRLFLWHLMHPVGGNGMNAPMTEVTVGMNRAIEARSQEGYLALQGKGSRELTLMARNSDKQVDLLGSAVESLQKLEMPQTVSIG